MSMAAALRKHDDTTDADSIVVLHDVSWEDYERLLASVIAEIALERAALFERVERALH